MDLVAQVFKTSGVDFIDKTLTVSHPEIGEVNTPKVVGKVSRELRAAAAIEWKISDYFALTEGVNHIESPKFSFSGAEWCLRSYPNGRAVLKSDGWLELYLIRVNSIFKEHYVAYCLGIRCEDGELYDSFFDEHKFEGNETCSGKPQFIKRSDLLELKGVIFSQDVVTFFCRFHQKINESEVPASQTIPYESLGTLLQNLKELLSGEDCDVVLKVQNKEFMAHKAILKVRSPVFRSMFTHKMKEDISGVVEITDCDPTAFGDFLHFVYCGKVEKFCTDRVFDLYFVADKYDVVELKTMCVDFIIGNLSKNTFFDALTFSLEHRESMVLKRATNFFVENAIEIVETAQWLSFQIKSPVAANELVINALKKGIPK